MDCNPYAEAPLSEIVCQTVEPIVFMDMNGRIRLWNRGAELLFGWTRDEAIGQQIDILFPDQNCIAPNIQDIRESPEESVVLQDYETALLAHDGREIPVKITVTLITGPDGNLAGSSLTVRDLTREKTLENELKWRTGEMELLDSIVHAGQESLDLTRILRIILTAVTAGSGLGFNRAILFLITDGKLKARLAVGVSSWEEAGRLWPRVASLNGLQEVIDHVLSEELHERTHVQDIAEGWTIPLEEGDNVLVQCVQDFASRIWPHPEMPADGVAARLSSENFAVVPLCHGGEGIGVILADNVVTHRPIDKHALRLLRLLANEASYAISNARLYESLLEHAANLRAANEQMRAQQELVIQGQNLAALGEIAESISHEMRSPLVPIGGFARTMRRELPDDSKFAPMLDTIIREVGRLEQVLSSVIALARPPLPVLGPVSLETIVEDVYSFYRPDASMQNIALVEEIPENLPEPHLDSDQWHQLFLHLTATSISYLPNGGTITTKAEQLEDGSYRVTVSDTRTGVTYDDIPKVFSAFYAGKPTADGIGLNLVAEIIRLHHGSVQVDGNNGRGISVRIDIPPPGTLHALVDADIQAAEELSAPQRLDPLTVAAMRKSGGAPGQTQ